MFDNVQKAVYFYPRNKQPEIEPSIAKKTLLKKSSKSFGLPHSKSQANPQQLITV